MANNSHQKNYSKQIYFGGEKRRRREGRKKKRSRGSTARTHTRTHAQGSLLSSSCAPGRRIAECAGPRGGEAPRPGPAPAPPTDSHLPSACDLHTFQCTQREGTCVQWEPWQNELHRQRSRSNDIRAQCTPADDGSWHAAEGGREELGWEGWGGQGEPPGPPSLSPRPLWEAEDTSGLGALLSLWILERRRGVPLCAPHMCQ